jgi:hypothetical protein
MATGGLAGGLLVAGYLWAIELGSLPLVFVCAVIVQGIFFQMWNATFATFFQEQFPMRIRVTGFAVSQNVGLMSRPSSRASLPPSRLRAQQTSR